MKRFLWLAVIAACSEGSEPAAIVHGPYTLAVSADGMRISLLRSDAELVSFGSDGFEVGIVNRIDDSASYDPWWLEPEGETIVPDPPAGLRFLKLASARAVVSGDRKISVEQTFDNQVTARLSLEASGEANERGARFSASWAIVSAPSVAFLRARATVAADEGFYGLGDASDHVDHRGFRRSMQIEADLGIESANNEMHVPVPLVIGTRGWGLFAASRRAGVFDVAKKDPARVELTFAAAPVPGDEGRALSMHLFGAQHPLDVTKLYYDVTGYPLLPATWAYGPWIWRDENRDQAEVEDDVRKIRELDLATSAIWIDRPYATKVNSFDFEAARFPDPAAMIRRAHNAGLRVALWSTPYLEEGTEPLLSEAKTRGFFPVETNLRLNGWGDPIDFTNPEAFEWWQGLIARYTSMGIEGFKLDYGEDIVVGLAGGRTVWRFHDGTDERVMHHGYTLLYHRAYAEQLPASGGFLLCRGGRWGDQTNVSVIWPGDLDATLTRFKERFTPRGSDDEVVGVGGLPSALLMGLNLGVSGFPFYGSDTGGYRHSPPDRETFTRWFQQTALSTVMQVGDSSSQPPWVYTTENERNDEVLALYREYARLHLRLFPYVWSYAVGLAVDGRAIMRPFGLAFPSLGVHPDDQYMFGDALLVAPVLERGAVAREVVFPPGEWIDWWSGERINGPGSMQVAAPLEMLPLYMRAGAPVVMLRPNIDTLSPVATSTSPSSIESWANDRGVLWVRIAVAVDESETAFLVHDGTTIVVAGRSVSVMPGDDYRSGVMIEVIGERMPATVAIDGASISRHGDPPEPSSWSFVSEAGGTVRVAVPPGAHRVTF